ncbi:Rv0361 family membrane protein [Hamadaea tsunoensis]|uniref:Rv0361 family membrane protein n=1 Tax=Hamadaea tsunoensis TaxID=53368 RepID=UPI0006851EA3|nr:hypothetical protein [Hamadaea tsunoensis]
MTQPTPDPAHPAGWPATVPPPPPSGPVGHPPVAAPPLERIPPGPGVRPPFVAAPTEGGNQRVWWAVGTAVLAVLLVCGGGVAVFTGMIVTGVRAVNDQAHKVVGDYLTALEHERYNDAYALLCDRMRQRYDLNDFKDAEQDTAGSTGYTLGKFDVATLEMPVELKFGTRTQNVTYQLAQDASTGHLEICGTA